MPLLFHLPISHNGQMEQIMRPILVTGATGYIGGRLIPELLKRGYRVRAMARSKAKLAGRPWGTHPAIEIVTGDVTDKDSLITAMTGCEVAFYLVHSMTAAPSRFATADRVGAKNFADAAATANLQRIIYLSGLGKTDDPNLSAHLRSRHETGRVLSAGPVPVTTFRTAMIIGSGSASFEIMRYLVERLPIMITPKWVHTPLQPIAVRNVLAYLVGAIDTPETTGKTFDIGGPEILNYAELFQIFAEESGLFKRIIIPVPVLTPTLSAYWIHLVTPIPGSIARPLAEGLSSRVVTEENEIRHLIPQHLLTNREAIARALEKTGRLSVESSWSDAGTLIPPEWAIDADADYAGGTLFIDRYRIVTTSPIKSLWKKTVSIGGEAGWLYGRPLWQLRGWLDRLAGGHGLARGRRAEGALHTGDAIDFWRVLTIEPEQRLLLLSEMRLPGVATLTVEFADATDGAIAVTLTARFEPKGLLGLLYWYAVSPFHWIVFPGMLKNLGQTGGGVIRSGPSRLVPLH
jgi:uncharacterized protein YbjT (DUF2867 family)